MSHQKKIITHTIQRVYENEKFWKILIEDSYAQSGPFDGGCLICAKAIIRAVGRGSLVRVTSNYNSAEHYGAYIDNVIYDFNGAFRSSVKWIRSFADNEIIRDRTLGFAKGYSDDTDIPDDPRAEKMIASLLSEVAESIKIGGFHRQ